MTQLMIEANCIRFENGMIVGRSYRPPPNTYKMTVYSLRIYVYENGQRIDLDNYSGQEAASLTDTIHGLWSTPYLSDIFFYVCDNDQWLSCLYCTIGNDQNAPFPEEWLTKILKYGYGKTAETYRLVGDKIPIQPEQYGLSPWPADVKVLFEIS